MFRQTFYYAYKPRPDGTVPIDRSMQGTEHTIQMDSQARRWAQMRFGPTAICYWYPNQSAMITGAGRRVL